MTHATQPLSPPLTRREAAAFLKVKETTLANWARLGKGPRFARSSDRRGKVWYRLEELERYLAQQSVELR